MTIMRLSPMLLAGLLATLMPLRPAAAQPVHATYAVHAAGMTILEVEAVFDLTEAGYRVRTSLRTRGMAASFVSGEQTSQVIGGWSGVQPRPRDYRSDGTWRGQSRNISLAWTDGDPVVRAMEPADEADREPVSPSLRRGTIDALSAIALLSRTVAATGGCEGAALVFDGRRRSDFASTTGGREMIRPWRDAWHGEALRCSFEGRLVAGFQRDRPRDQAARPQRGQAWIAAPYPGAPPIPVRIDIPTRWFGTATAVLLRIGTSALPGTGTSALPGTGTSALPGTGTSDLVGIGTSDLVDRRQ